MLYKKGNIVEVYKWGKPRYLGRIINYSTAGGFYEIRLLSQPENTRFMHWGWSMFLAADLTKDIVKEDYLHLVCYGRKSVKCDICNHRFTCFTAR